MAYAQVSYGSQGSSVKELQKLLNNNGYSLNVDGIFGSKTQSAVRDYQSKNGLAVDGIVGNNTWSSLTSSKSGESSGATATPTTGGGDAKGDTDSGSGAAAGPDYSNYQYDPSGDKAYMEALAALQAAQKDKPVYAGTYDGQLEEIYNSIVNRDKFSYDLNGDALYQQYKDQYMLQGQMAMMDTMGQAAALTGGYGNSYASTAGNQAYQAYLQQLNEVVPDLYGIALNQYNAEGDRLMDQYAMVGDMRDTEYGRYQDALDQYWQNVSLLQGQADDAYDRGYENWYNAYQMGVEAENTAYQKQQDAYERLAELIAGTGYSPSAEELAAAGMTSAQASGYKKAYTDSQASSGGSGGGGSSGGGSSRGYSYDTHGYSTSEIKALQKAAGITQDGIWGPKTQAAYEAGYRPGDTPKTADPEPTYNIEDDLNYYISQGASKSEINSFLRAALNSGRITQAEYNSLKKTYAPAGYTY